jgi:hypothetical protein
LIKATEFAEQFYDALASQATVQQAFDTAGAFINTNYEQSKEIKIHRDLSWQGKESAAAHEISWGLYINKDCSQVLEWKLPSRRFPPPPPIDNGDESQPIVRVNTLLLDTLPYEIAQYSAKVSRLLADEETDPRDIRQALMDSFPAPVGLQLRRLFNIYTINVDRLRQLFITYETIAKLICFTMLSQLWDEKYKNPGIVIHEDSLVEIKNLLRLEAGNYKEFNCFKLIKTNTGIFYENKIDYFVEELSTLRESFLDKDEFYQAHLFMEEIKRELIRDNIKANEIEDFCVQAEKHLSVILKKLAFITRYKLTTIRNIEIIKLKHKEPRFKHKKVFLDKITAGFAVQISEHDSFTDNKSVILLKSSKDVSTYLDLSPFVIDKSVLYKDKRDKPEKLSVLYFYSYQDTSNPDYYYSSFEKERVPLIVSDKEYKEIKEQWEEFKEDVLA